MSLMRMAIAVASALVLAALTIGDGSSIGWASGPTSGGVVSHHHRAASVGADFNGDGYGDLAIGVPTEDLSTAVLAAAAGPTGDQGAVLVLYGSRHGLSARGSQLWTQDSPGVLGRAEAGDRFGIRLCTGDFDADGYSDLAIGASHESVGGVELAGVVTVLYGSSAGLRARGNQLWTQNSPGVRGVAGAGDRFGDALAAGDFDRDGYTDLAVGAPEDVVRGIPVAGAVNVLYGSPRGLTAVGNQRFTQATRGVADVPEIYDQFGTSLAAADMDGDGDADLAIGVPGESTPATESSGAVHVLYGGRRGLSVRGSRLWTQDSPGVAGKAQDGDMLGQRMAAGDLNADGFADLALGAPGETVGDQVAAGGVTVLYGSRAGIRARASQFLTQDSPGIRGTAEFPDQFGFGLSIGDLSGDGIADLVVGPYDESFAAYQAGAVQVLLGSPSGVTAAGNRLWTQDSPKVRERSETGDLFGQSTYIGDFDGDGHLDLAIGASGESVGSVERAGAVNVLYGSPWGIRALRNQLWTQDSPGIADRAEEADYFGELP